MGNVELFRKIKTQVEGDPDSLQMSLWYTPDAGAAIGSSRCGTAACVAGWAVYLSDGNEAFCDSEGGRSANGELDFCITPDGLVVEVEDRARELLGLTFNQAINLFYDMGLNASNFTERVQAHAGVVL